MQNQDVNLNYYFRKIKFIYFQATITKLWGGCCRDAVLDADNFVIEFILNTSVEEKALVLATAFLIDLMYFENSG